MSVDNRFILEMIGRHRHEELLRDAERDRLLRKVQRENREPEKPLWERVVTWMAGTAQAVVAGGGASSASDSGGRMANATGAGEVPGL